MPPVLYLPSVINRPMSDRPTSLNSRDNVELILKLSSPCRAAQSLGSSRLPAFFSHNKALHGKGRCNSATYKRPLPQTQSMLPLVSLDHDLRALTLIGALVTILRDAPRGCLSPPKDRFLTPDYERACHHPRTTTTVMEPQRSSARPPRHL